MKLAILNSNDKFEINNIKANKIVNDSKNGNNSFISNKKIKNLIINIKKEIKFYNKIFCL